MSLSLLDAPVSWCDGEGLYKGDEVGSTWGEWMWVGGDVWTTGCDGEVDKGGWDDEGISYSWWLRGVVKTSFAMNASHEMFFCWSWCMTTILMSEWWNRLCICWLSSLFRSEEHTSELQSPHTDPSSSPFHNPSPSYHDTRALSSERDTEAAWTKMTDIDPFPLTYQGGHTHVFSSLGVKGAMPSSSTQ